jgi:hypothetical protein
MLECLTLPPGIDSRPTPYCSSMHIIQPIEQIDHAKAIQGA